MRIMTRLRRFAAVLAGAVATMAAFAGAASASTEMLRPGGAGGPAQPGPIVHTVVVGGMPGWQIALIAAGTAFAAAIAAVLLDRARSGRRLITTPA
jgi:hypothetical protein